MPNPLFVLFVTSKAFIHLLNGYAIHLRSSYPFRSFPTFIFSILVINTTTPQPHKPEVWTLMYHLCVYLVTKYFLFYVIVVP